MSTNQRNVFVYSVDLNGRQLYGRGLSPAEGLACIRSLSAEAANATVDQLTVYVRDDDVGHRPVAEVPAALGGLA